MVERPIDTRAIRGQIIDPNTGRSLSQQGFSELLGVSVATAARWDQGKGIDSRNRRMVLRLKTVLTALGDKVLPEHKMAWLTQPIPEALNFSPLDLVKIDDPNSLDPVLNRIEAVASGSFS